MAFKTAWTILSSPVCAHKPLHNTVQLAHLPFEPKPSLVAVENLFFGWAVISRELLQRHGEELQILLLKVQSVPLQALFSLHKKDVRQNPEKNRLSDLDLWAIRAQNCHEK